MGEVGWERLWMGHGVELRKESRYNCAGCDSLEGGLYSRKSIASPRPEGEWVKHSLPQWCSLCPALGPTWDELLIGEGFMSGQ